MKKALLIMICVLAAAGVSAQSHTFRDTSYVPYWQFDYDAWVMEDPIHNGKIFYPHPCRPYTRGVLCRDDLLQYNYTDNPAGMKLVGLSAHVCLIRAQISPNAPSEYLLLYEATPDSFTLKAQVQWDESDTAGRPDGSYMVNTINCHNNSNIDGISTYYYADVTPYAIKIYDYYFDKPITVYDSFYVGGTCYVYYIYFLQSHILLVITTILFLNRHGIQKTLPVFPLHFGSFATMIMEFKANGTGCRRTSS